MSSYDFAFLLSDGLVANWGFASKSSDSWIGPSSVSEKLKSDLFYLFDL